MSIEAEPAVFIFTEETNVRHLSLCEDVPECVVTPNTELELRARRVAEIQVSAANRREIVESTVMLRDVGERMGTLAIEKAYWTDRLKRAEATLVEIKKTKKDYRDRI